MRYGVRVALGIALLCAGLVPEARAQVVRGRTAVDAMLAVHAHAFFRGHPEEYQLKVLSLADAAEVLAADDSPGGRSRRRRAAARIAAYGFDGKGFPAAFRTALVKLHVNPEELAGVLGGLLAAATANPGTSVSSLETSVGDQPFLTSLTPDCKWEKLEQWITPPGPPAPTDVATTVSIRVPRPLAQVAAAVDPQSLDECGKFFCPSTPAPGGTYLASKGWLGSVIPQPALPAGKPYPAPQLLFEHFRCPAQSGCSADVENLLNVNTFLGAGDTVSPSSSSPPIKSNDRYWASYTLEEPLKTVLNGSKQTLLLDEGWVWAEAGAGASLTEIQGSKHVQYASDVAQGLIYAVLLQAELAGELAEVACCPTPAPPGRCQ